MKNKSKIKSSKSKLKLDDLKVQSFITSLESSETDKVLGGSTDVTLLGNTCVANCVSILICQSRNCQPSNNCYTITCPNTTNCATGVFLCDTRYPYCGLPGGTGNGGCFLAGTLVNTTSQQYMNIEDLKIGDYVLSYDYKQKKMLPNKVADLHEILQPKYYIINKTIKTTANHPFLVNGKWQEVKDIIVGDELVDTNLKGVKVDSLEVVEAEAKVYNLTVENAHTFFIHDILVHNKTLASGRGANCAGGTGGALN